MKKFESVNGGTRPTKLIIYRDGVSEGQMEALIESEAKPIQSEAGNAKIV